MKPHIHIGDEESEILEKYIAAYGNRSKAIKMIIRRYDALITVLSESCTADPSGEQLNVLREAIKKANPVYAPLVIQTSPVGFSDPVEALVICDRLERGE